MWKRLFPAKRCSEGNSRLKDRVALVTGAASGIGRATALALADAGAKLIVCDVNQEGLDVVGSSLAERAQLLYSQRVDVSDRAAMAAFADIVHKKVPAVDVLVNNAGVGLHGGILNSSLQDLDWMMSINLGGVLHGCHFFIPKMVARQRGGHVVNIASVFGIVASPSALGYSAAKFAVVGLSEGLRMELADDGIAVSVICPGMISTKIVKDCKYSAAPGIDVEALRTLATKIWAKRRYPPEKVAATILDAIYKHRPMVPVTPEAWLAYWLKRIAPNSTFALGRTMHRRVLDHRVLRREV